METKVPLTKDEEAIDVDVHLYRSMIGSLMYLTASRPDIMYALTSNPTIYDSLVKQFWQTATTNTIADGTLEINATIDTIGYTITEASIRDTLQLEYATWDYDVGQMMNFFDGWGKWGILLMEPSLFGKVFSHPNGDI
ncbi:hypothetical protein Tco_0015168 [Tanacetum coccineum]